MTTMLIGHVRGTRLNNVEGLLYDCAENFDVDLRIDMIKTGWVSEVVFYTLTGEPDQVKLFEATLKNSINNHPANSARSDTGETEDPDETAMAIGILFATFIVGMIIWGICPAT